MDPMTTEPMRANDYLVPMVIETTNRGSALSTSTPGC